MDDMSMEDLMSGAGQVNTRAKMMNSLQRQAAQLRKMGFEPQEVDLLLRGKVGALRPDEGDAYAEVMRKMALMGRVQAVPGMTKSLRGYPGADMSSSDQRGAAMRGALEDLGFGGGGMSLQDLMR